MGEDKEGVDGEAEKGERSGIRPLPPPTDYLTLSEAGALLRVSRRRMEILIKRGVLPTAKIGARRLLRRIDISALIDSLMTTTDKEES